MRDIFYSGFILTSCLPPFTIKSFFSPLLQFSPSLNPFNHSLYNTYFLITKLILRYLFCNSKYAITYNGFTHLHPPLRNTVRYNIVNKIFNNLPRPTGHSLLQWYYIIKTIDVNAVGSCTYNTDFIVLWLAGCTPVQTRWHDAGVGAHTFSEDYQANVQIELAIVPDVPLWLYQLLSLKRLNQS